LQTKKGEVVTTQKETTLTQATDPQEPQAPTITVRQQQANETLKLFQAAWATVPGYNDDLAAMKKGDRRLCSKEFVAAAVSGIQSHERLSGIEPDLPNKALDAAQTYEAYAPIYDFNAAALRKTQNVFLRNDAEVSRASWRTFHQAKRLLRERPRDAQLFTIVERLKAARPRRKAKQEPEAPAPVEKGGAIAA
jgi:hypothetical protein